MKQTKLLTLVIILLVSVLALTACTTLSSAKSDAIDSLDSALAQYSSSDYSTEDYATITTAYNSALDAINAVTDKNDLPGTFVSDFTSAADAVLTLAQQQAIEDAKSLETKQSEALALLATAYASYDSSDYTTDNYATITTAYNSAVDAINAVTDKDNLPGTFVSDFTATADAVVTIAEQAAADLLAAQNSVLSDLAEAYEQYDSSDYTTDNYATITTAYNSAVDAVEAVIDISKLPGTFVSDFVSTADAVSVRQYVVTFDSDIGTAVDAQTLDKGDSVDSAEATTTSTSYTFLSWMLDGVVYDLSTPVTSDITLIAQWDVTSDFEFDYDETTGEYTVIAYSGSTKIVTIPATYDGTNGVAPVTTISAATNKTTGVFYNATNIEYLILSENLTTIGAYAFYNCTSLVGVTLPSTLESIGNQAFRYCSSLTNVYYSGTMDSWSMITSTLYTPMYYASHFYMLEDGSYNEVTSIELTSATSISAYAFYGFNNLVSVTLSDTVTSIGNQAFSGCSALTSIVIPETVTSIGTNAFQYCSALTSIVIPEGVTTIGSQTFYECSSLAEVILPSTLESISTNVFENCTSLTEVTLPSTLTTMGNSAFYGCTSLTEITIPSSVTSIGTRVFNNCTSLTAIYVDSDNENYQSIDGVLFSIDGTTLVAYPAGNSATTYTISSSVTSINSYAFYSAANLITVLFADDCSLTALPSNCFQYCTSLTTITLPSSITSIGYACFQYCSNLSSIYVNCTGSFSFGGSAVASVAEDCVVYYAGSYSYSTATTVTFVPFSPVVTSGDYQYYVVGGYATIYKYVGTDTEVTIPTTIGDENYAVTAIASYAFELCSDITKITVPYGVTTIGSYAFYDCVSLVEVVLPDSITSIGSKIVSTYTTEADGRTGVTFVIGDADVMLLVMSSDLFSLYYSGATSPENTIKLSSDIVFDGGDSISGNNYALTLFTGTIDGDGHSISGLDTLSEGSLINYCGNATFTDLEIIVSTDGGSLVTYAVGDYVVFDNIKTSGSVYLTTGVANYSPIICISVGSTVTFNNVNTYADITVLGYGYFSSFLGGYSTGDVTFTNCINYGDLVGSNPSVFIGNYNSNMSGVSVTLSETVYNLGAVVGYSASGYFGVATVNGDDAMTDSVARIESVDANVSPTLSKVSTGTDESGYITITDSGSDATQYMVSYYAWATLTSGGTRLIVISYTVDAEDMLDTELPSNVLMTTTLPESETFVDDTSGDSYAAAMLYQADDGQWYLYVVSEYDTFTLSDATARVVVAGLDSNQSVVY